MESLPVNSKHEAGQALLLVLLSMAVVLTAAMSILSTSITDIAITSREEEALRAFSAAETGIERALITGSSDSGTVGDAKFTATVTTVTGESEFVYPVPISSGESAVVWFVAHDTSGNLVCNSEYPCYSSSSGSIKVCWGQEGTPSGTADTPAIEASVFYTATPGDYSTVQVAREVIDPWADRRSSNNFVATDGVGCTLGETKFAFSKTLNMGDLNVLNYETPNGVQFISLKTIYNTTAQPVGLSAGATLPAQGLLVESTGTSGEANRKVQVFRAYGAPPPIFETALFSATGISQ